MRKREYDRLVEIYDLLIESKEAIERQRKALENATAELKRLEKLLTSEFGEE